VNSERIASKIGNPEDFGEGDPTVQGDAVGRKIKMEEVVEENYNELFGSVPEIEPAAGEQLGMSSGSSEPELNSYWFTSDHLVSLSLDKYGKVAVDFCSNQGARKEHSPSYATEEQRRVEQKDQDLVRLDLVIMTLRSSAFVTDGSGVAIQHLEIDRREIREPPLKPEQGREQYMVFGEVFVDQRRTGFGTPYKFNAKELDCELGYYYYGARYYDPQFGRFLTVDPLASDMPAWGSYTYTFDNPLTVIDPDGRSGESIHKDANGNIIAEIDDGDNNVYIHNDIQAGQHIDGKISRLKQKREEYGFGGGGEVDLLASVKNKISRFFEEGDQQQHSGENWFIYGKGAENGWSITAPKPNPYGKNNSIEFGDMFFPTGRPKNGQANMNFMSEIGNAYEVGSRLSGQNNAPKTNDTIYNCLDCSLPYRDSSGILVPTLPNSNLPQQNIRSHAKKNNGF